MALDFANMNPRLKCEAWGTRIVACIELDECLVKFGGACFTRVPRRG